MDRSKRQLSRQQGGFTLIEMVIAMVILVVMVSLAIVVQQQDAQREANAQSGAWLRVLASSAKAYQKANTAALQAAAGPTSPAIVTPAQLASYLPSGFSTTSPNGQAFTVRFLEPTAGKLEGLIVLTGGDNLTGMDLLQVAGAAGGGAGYVNPSNTNEGKGPRGAWSISLSNWGGSPGLGKPLYALFYDDAADSGSNDYLNRSAISGHPEVNRMNTAIDMASQNIANANNITASTVDTSGGVKANAISIGKSSFGATPYPYETVQLNSGYNMRMAIGTREHSVFQNDGTFNTHGNIKADASLLASGSVLADGNVQGTEFYARNWFRTQGTGGWYSESYGGGWYMTDPTWVRVYNNRNVYTAGLIRGGSLQADGDATVGGTLTGGAVTSNGRLTTGEFVQINGQAGEGGGCSPNGLVGRTAAGKLLSCESGRWRAGGGVTASMTISGGQASGPQWAYAECPSGWYLAGGGYNIVSMQKASSQEAPQVNRPDGNRWAIYGGGTSGAIESRWVVYATCVQ